MRKIAILVLGCASDPYVGLIDTIRRSWGRKRVEGVDIFYVFGLPNGAQERAALMRWYGGELSNVAEGGIHRDRDLLLTGCADNIRVQEDCILHKRLIAFRYLASEYRYDFIYTTCAASYVDQYELAYQVAGLRGEKLVAGAVGIDSTRTTPYVSGASMLLTADVARYLGEHRSEIAAANRFGFRDDVAIGFWLADHLAARPREATRDDIENRRPLPDDCVFYPTHTSVDYVRAAADDLLPRQGIFHYHFHSAKARDIADFHDRYFLHQMRSFSEGLPDI